MTEAVPSFDRDVMFDDLGFRVKIFGTDIVFIGGGLPKWSYYEGIDLREEFSMKRTYSANGCLELVHRLSFALLLHWDGCTLFREKLTDVLREALHDVPECTKRRTRRSLTWRRLLKRLRQMGGSATHGRLDKFPFRIIRESDR